MLIWFLVFVVVIFLFVGGIGVMNIMLVNVFECKREIGLCIVIGVKFCDILC